VTRTGLKVVADIAEGYSGKVRQGNEVLLNFPDINKESKAKIAYVSQTINALNRTFRVDIPVSGQDLVPNMIATIKVIDYKKRQVCCHSNQPHSEKRKGRLCAHR